MDERGILITGAGGQLGRALVTRFPGAKAVSRAALDVSDAADNSFSAGQAASSCISQAIVTTRCACSHLSSVMADSILGAVVVCTAAPETTTSSAACRRRAPPRSSSRRASRA